MRRLALSAVLALLCLVAARSASAQSTSSGVTTSVPRVVRLTGVFVPANGMPPAPVETITLAIYADDTGGAPLWQETQYVTLDSAGRYTVLPLRPLPRPLHQHQRCLHRPRRPEPREYTRGPTTTPSEPMR